MDHAVIVVVVSPLSSARFANASLDMAREDYPSELGALKIFNPRAAGPEAEQQALGRIRNEIAILKQDRPGLLKLLDSNESELWMVTEYCRQGTLEQHLQKYKGNTSLVLRSFFPLVQIVRIYTQDEICTGSQNRWFVAGG